MAVIAIDFDGTIVDGDYKPLEGAKDAICLLREHGHKIVIHSCNRPKFIKEVLRDNDIPFDAIAPDDFKPMNGKINCDLYIDDKGYHFTDWSKDKVSAILDRVSDLDNRRW